MISIIISSYQPHYLEALKINIENTIGVPYELICIKNPGLMGICEAYNRGGQKAKFPYLCFLHEDIIFQTENWGFKVVDHFIKNEKLGLLGIAGNIYKPYVLSGWGSSWGGDLTRINFYQASKNENPVTFINLNSSDRAPDRVATLDGCFLCTKNNIFSSIKFDEVLFKDYHCYDIDYSLSVGEKYDVEVVYDIFLTHFSYGGYNKKWFQETVKLHKKWNQKLPYNVQKLSLIEIQEQETGAYYFILNKVLEFDYGYNYLLKINFSKKFIKLIGFKNWLWIQVKLPKNLINFYKTSKKPQL